MAEPADVDTATLVDQLAAEGTLLAETAAETGWAAPVPRLGWTVGELVRHTGAIHRWTTTLVRTRADTLSSAGELTDSGPGEDAELLGWFAAGLAELVATLGDAPGDLRVATLVRTDDPRRFWARRQAHETAIHRADVQAAAGRTADFDGAFAHDGIDELLTFARGRPFAIPAPGTIDLVATDGVRRRITCGGERNVVEPGPSDSTADVTVRGTPAQLYLWVWNRAADVSIDGDDSLAAQWARHVRIRRG